jgi:hypothetical protein
MTIGEIGLATLYELYQAVRTASGHPPVVIDSADLVTNPAGIMAAYCDAVGIPFREQALNWQSGPRAEWSRSARWHAAVEGTSTFTELASSYPETVANNAKLAEFSAYHEPYYQELHASRLVSRLAAEPARISRGAPRSCNSRSQRCGGARVRHLGARASHG